MHTPLLSDLPPAHAAWVEIDIHAQSLTLWHGQTPGHRCLISTGKAGTGQHEGSGQTPLGWHYVRAAIGADAPDNAAFRGRRETGDVYTPALAARHPERDWVLSRILWLCGLEKGHNRGGQVDSQRRYIYLHGTPPDEPMGVPASHGCVRLRLDDLHYLFTQAPPGTPVWLHDSST
jgi:hypothetical protein